MTVEILRRRRALLCSILVSATIVLLVAVVFLFTVLAGDSTHQGVRTLVRSSGITAAVMALICLMGVAFYDHRIDALKHRDTERWVIEVTRHEDRPE